MKLIVLRNCCFLGNDFELSAHKELHTHIGKHKTTNASPLTGFSNSAAFSDIFFNFFSKVKPTRNS